MIFRNRHKSDSKHNVTDTFPDMSATVDFINAMPSAVSVQQAFARQWEWLADSPHSAPLIISNTDRHAFLGALLATLLQGRDVIAADWQWGTAEWASVARQLPGSAMACNPMEIGQWPPPGDGPFAASGWIGLPTGGSSGQVRFAVHTLKTLAAAVDGYRRFFACDRLHSVSVLPMHHVGGLMQAMRAWMTGGQLVITSLDDIGRGVLPQMPPGGQVHLSLVPTQLIRLLRQPAAVACLRRFDAVLLGGAPAPEPVLQEARREGIALAPSYGMTETAAAVAIQKPTDFLSGKAMAATPLPHVRVRIVPADYEIELAGPSLFHGYWPERRRSSPYFATRDAGDLDADGNLSVWGRLDRVILTGGKNVFAEEVEAAISATGLVKEAAVYGVPDTEWGERVVACVSGCGDLEILKASMRERIAPYKIPKTWHHVSDLPRNPMGKINYRELALRCG